MKEKPHWPGWFYGPNGEAEIFQSRDEVPKGWEDHPSKVEIAEIAGNRVISAPDFEVPDEPVKAKRGRPKAKK